MTAYRHAVRRKRERIGVGPVNDEILLDYQISCCSWSNKMFSSFPSHGHRHFLGAIDAFAACSVFRCDINISIMLLILSASTCPCWMSLRNRSIFIVESLYSISLSREIFMYAAIICSLVTVLR